MIDIQPHYNSLFVRWIIIGITLRHLLIHMQSSGLYWYHRLPSVSKQTAACE